MAHISGPTSWTPLGILRWLASAAFALLFAVFAEENIRHFLELKHWNEFLSEAVSNLPDLSPVLEHEAFWFAFGFATGAFLALWLARLLQPAAASTSPPRAMDEMISPLEIKFDENDASFVRPIRGLHGSKGERFWIGLHNSGPHTLDGVTLRAQEGWFVEHTISIAHQKWRDGVPSQERVPVIIDLPHLDPSATEMVELFGVSYNSQPNKHDVLGDVRRFVLEARARNVNTVVQEFEYDPKGRPMIKRVVTANAARAASRKQTAPPDFLLQ